MDNDKLLLTIPEVALRLGLGRSLIYELVMRGEIKSITIGRARRIPVGAIDEFIRLRLGVAHPFGEKVSA